MLKIKFFPTHMMTVIFFLVSLELHAKLLEKNCHCPQTHCSPCFKRTGWKKNIQMCGIGNLIVCKKPICEKVKNFKLCKLEVTKHSNIQPSQIFFPKKTVRNKTSPPPVSPHSRDPLPPKRLKAQGLIEVKKNYSMAHTRTQKRVLAKNPMKVGLVQGFSTHLVLIRGEKRISVTKKTQIYTQDQIINTGLREQKLTLSLKTGVAHLALSPRGKLVFPNPNSLPGGLEPLVDLISGELWVKTEIFKGTLDVLAGSLLTRSKNSTYKVKHLHLENPTIQVESLEGGVQVNPVAKLLSPWHPIKSGYWIRWVEQKTLPSAKNKPDSLTMKEGFLTPLLALSMNNKRKMASQNKSNSQQNTNFSQKTKSTPPTNLFFGTSSHKPKIQPKAPGSFICESPRGQFQECSWTCQGNPANSSTCQAHGSQVFCLRQTCNASGQWANPTPFSSSYKDLCPPQGSRVGDCLP